MVLVLSQAFGFIYKPLSRAGIRKQQTDKWLSVVDDCLLQLMI